MKIRLQLLDQLENNNHHIMHENKAAINGPISEQKLPDITNNKFQNFNLLQWRSQIRWQMQTTHKIAQQVKQQFIWLRTKTISNGKLTQSWNKT